LGPTQTIQDVLREIGKFLTSSESKCLYDYFAAGDFTRSGPINPAQLIVNDLLNFGQSCAASARSLRDDFDIFTPELLREGTGVSPSAVSQARLKIPPKIWEELNKIVIEAFNTRPGLLTFKGHPVVSVDGTIVWSNTLISSDFEKYLTPVQRARLAKRKKKKGAYHEQLQMLMLFDPLNQIHLGHAVEMQVLSERDLLLPFLDQMTRGQLALLDRGYPAAWLFVEMMRREVEFVTRLRKDHSKAVEDFFAGDKNDGWLELPIVDASADKLKELGTPMPESRSVRVRVLRVRDDDGKELLLATSLSETTANPAELADLYCHRWEIEKEICTFKQPLCLEGWRSFCKHGIEYDLGAKALAYNLMKLMSWPVRQEFQAQGLSGSGFRKVVCDTRALGELRPALLPILRTMVGGKPRELSADELLQRFEQEVRHKPSVIDPRRKRPLGNNRGKPDRRHLSQRKHP
jgi:hypothetical protein